MKGISTMAITATGLLAMAANAEPILENLFKKPIVNDVRLTLLDHTPNQSHVNLEIY